MSHKNLSVSVSTVSLIPLIVPRYKFDTINVLLFTRYNGEKTEVLIYLDLMNIPYPYRVAEIRNDLNFRTVK